MNTISLKCKKSQLLIVSVSITVSFGLAKNASSQNKKAIAFQSVKRVLFLVGSQPCKEVSDCNTEY